MGSCSCGPHKVGARIAIRMAVILACGGCGQNHEPPSPSRYHLRINPRTKKSTGLLKSFKIADFGTIHVLKTACHCPEGRPLGVQPGVLSATTNFWLFSWQMESFFHVKSKRPYTW